MKYSEFKYKSVKIRHFFLCNSIEGKQLVARTCIQRGEVKEAGGNILLVAVRVGSGSFGAMSIKGVETDPWTVEKNHMGEFVTQLNS